MTTNQVATELGCVRSYLDILMLKGLLKPVATTYPRFYFNSEDVLELKKSLNLKVKSNV
jgi:hypothetical protein